jgi:hypothetical protein
MSSSGNFDCRPSIALRTQIRRESELLLRTQRCKTFDQRSLNMLICIASQYQSPRNRLEFAGSNHCLRHLDRITDENLFAMKRNRATEMAYRRVIIHFHGSGVVGRTRDVGSGSAGFDQRDFDTELRDFRGRGARYLAPPAQIRTSPIRAYLSLRSSDAEGFRTVATTLSPRSSASSVKVRPKTLLRSRDQPVVCHFRTPFFELTAW